MNPTDRKGTSATVVLKREHLSPLGKVVKSRSKHESNSMAEEQSDGERRILADGAANFEGGRRLTLARKRSSHVTAATFLETRVEMYVSASAFKRRMPQTQSAL